MLRIAGMSWCFALLLLIEGTIGLDNGVARTPPMGFNSYLAGPSLKNELGLRRAADFIIESGMRELGYIYINTDEGWEEKTRHVEDEDGASSKGSLRWNRTLYPSGLPAFIESLHENSLKFGIYGAASGVTCGEGPGQLYYELQDARTYAAWGVDFLKSDNCASYALDSSVRFRAMRDALNATGHPILLSIEPFSMNPDPSQSSEVANMWRTGVDIDGDFDTFMDRADVADKWAPLAGPQYGWNDPDMINVQNPPTSDDDESGLSLGENRMYFGLWAIMKAPLLISSDLYNLTSDVLSIITNEEVIRVNQDSLGIPARKIQIGSQPVPWLVGLQDCSFPDSALSYSRMVRYQSGETGPIAGPGTIDTRKWTVKQAQSHGLGDEDKTYWIKNTATRRCLSVANGTVVLLPCDESTSSGNQWQFNKGISTVTSITHVNSGKALAVADSFLYAQIHDTDSVSVSDMAYGLGGLILVEPYDQANCTSRWCENYHPQQMWYYSKVDGMLRHSLYTSSMNHIRDSQQGHEDGYVLTSKVPTFRHHCLGHVLSTGNVGTTAGDTEVWGGPLEGESFVVGLFNRGSTPALVSANLELLLETSGYHDVIETFAWSNYVLINLYEGVPVPWQATSVISAFVPAHDILLLRLEHTASEMVKES